MRILFIGDVFGRPGRIILKQWLAPFRAERNVDFVVANVENAAGGKGITTKIFEELARLPIHVMTGGNHTFAQRESYNLIDSEPRILRPANLPPGTPGRGLGLYEAPGGQKVAVLNLMGRAFMKPIDCPFRKADELLDDARRQTPIVIVDFHAEATSEKIGMTHHLDGKVAAVIGTHTHIPTADARITPRATAAVTDVGMTGPYDSVIGVDKETVLHQLITGMPARHDVAQGEVRVCGLLIDVDDDSGRAVRVEAVHDPDYVRERSVPPEESGEAKNDA